MLTIWTTLRCQFLILLVAGATCFAQEKPEGTLEIQKVPPPSADQLTEGRKQVHEVFESDYKQAKSPEARWQLATKLVKRAADSQGDTVAEYALTMEGVDLFVGLGDALSAFAAIDRLTENFEVDVMAMKSDLLKRISKEAKAATLKKAAALAGIKLVGDAAVAEQYPVAKDLAALSLTLAKTTRDASLVKRATDLQTQMTEQAKVWQKVTEAKQALEKDPDDAAANDTLGRYLCLNRQNWEEGLPHLAKSSDVELRTTAELDLQTTEDPASRASTADAWWQLAEKKGEKDPERTQYLARVAWWYDEALPGLTALDRVTAEKRLEVAWQALSGRDFRKLMAVQANGFQVKGPVAFERTGQTVPMGNFDPRKSWLLAMQFNAPTFHRRGEDQRLLCWGDGTNDSPIYISLGSGHLDLILFDGVKQRSQYISTNLPPRLLNEWVDLKIVYDASRQELAMYLNHRMIQKDPVTCTPQTQNVMPMCLGGNIKGYQTFLGQLRNVWLGNIK